MSKTKKLLNPFAISTYITILMSFPCLLKKSYSVAKSWQSHNGALDRWYCYISRIVQVVPHFSPGLLYLFLVVWIVVAWRSSICLIAPLHLHQRPFLVLVLFLQVILVATSVVLIWWPLLSSLLLHPPLSCPLTNPASSKCPGERNTKTWFTSTLYVLLHKTVFFSPTYDRQRTFF